MTEQRAFASRRSMAGMDAVAGAAEAMLRAAGLTRQHVALARARAEEAPHGL